MQFPRLPQFHFGSRYTWRSNIASRKVHRSNHSNSRVMVLLLHVIKSSSLWRIRATEELTQRPTRTTTHRNVQQRQVIERKSQSDVGRDSNASLEADVMISLVQ